MGWLQDVQDFFGNAGGLRTQDIEKKNRKSNGGGSTNFLEKLGNQSYGSGQQKKLRIDSGAAPVRPQGTAAHLSGGNRNAANSGNVYRGPMARGDNFFDRSVEQVRQSNQRPPTPNPIFRQGMDAIFGKGQNTGLNMALDGGMQPGMSEADQGFQDILDGINERMEREYSGIDPAVKAMLDSAFAGQFSAIDKARGTANQNFGKSDAALESLYAGHVQDINTVDADRYKQITSDWKGGINEGYDSAINAASADRAAESERLAAMMQNLGTEQSGPLAAESAGILSEGIDGMRADKAGALAQAGTYGSADLSRNVARGQAVASQGAANRADLMGQLQSILGNLDNKRVDTEKEKSMAFLEADQQSRAAFQDERALNVESLAQLLDQRRQDTQWADEKSMRQEDRAFEMQRYEREDALAREQMAMEAQGEMASPNAGNVFAQIVPPGEDPTKWRNAYAQFSAEGNFNTNSGIPLDQAFSRWARAKGLDQAVASEVGFKIANSGTFKMQ